MKRKLGTDLRLAALFNVGGVCGTVRAGQARGDVLLDLVGARGALRAEDRAIAGQAGSQRRPHCAVFAVEHTLRGVVR